MYIKKAVTEDKFIFPEVRKKTDWDVEVVDWMSQWFKGNPQGNFVFWYDSRTVTPEQISATNQLFLELTETFLKGGSLILKDINELAVVKNNPQYFTAEIPIYLRLDLLRVIALLEDVEKCPAGYECASIYADIDKGIDDADNKLNRNDDGTLKTKDLSEEGLFDKTTIETLESNGLVMRSGSENSFLMVSNHKPNMLKALHTVVINSNFKRILRMLELEKQLRANLPTDSLKNAPLDKNFSKIDGFNELSPEIKAKLKDLGSDSINLVYNSMVYGPLLVYFNYLEKKLSLVVNEEKFGVGEVDFAEVFSQVDLKDRMELPLRLPQNELLLTYDAIADRKDYQNNDAYEEAKIEILYKELYLGFRPTKDIGGSSSQSYSLGW